MFSQPVRHRSVIDSNTERATLALDRGRRKILSILTWRATLWLIAISTLCRLIYLIWFCPYQLLGDEGYYWEQARHFDLCYNEKGPILAWLIAVSCRIFGDTEWAVRLPVALASTLAAWGVGRLTMSVTRGNQRAGFLAAGCFMLLPAFQANSIICTQDGILIALWLALSAVGLRLFRHWHAGESTWRDWLLLWIVLGFGVILKQSVLVFLPSLVLYAWIERRELRWRRDLIWQAIVGPAIVIAISSPMIVWNARHGWPMLGHTLGHLGAGGDQAGRVNRGNPLQWMLGLIVAVIGAMGPAVLLMVWASRKFAATHRADRSRWPDRLWMMCAAWPSVAFFVLLAMRKPVVPSWPLPSLVTLVVLVADFTVSEFAQPLVKSAWWAIIGYGLCGCLLIAFPTALAHLPIVGPHLQRRLIGRFTGHREDAAILQKTLAAIAAPDGQPPLIVARHYMQASLYCFYLPGHPTVYTAGKYLGKRSTTFDQWRDTNLENPNLYGRTLLLDGEGDVPWERALIFDQRRPLENGRYFLATDYRGPHADHPRLAADDD